MEKVLKRCTLICGKLNHLYIWCLWWIIINTIINITQVCSEFHVKCANYVRNIKSAISNIFGKVRIGKIPGQNASVEEIIAWKNSSSAKWAKENLWSKVDDDNEDDNDTYMNRITNEIFKQGNRTTENCAFVIAIVELIFDARIQSTTLTGEMISNRIKEKLNNLNEPVIKY